jgi:hypothetical protein
LSRNKPEDQLSQTILQLIAEKNPENIKQLVVFVKEKIGVPEKEIVEQIIRLENEGKISFQKPPTPPVQRLGTLLRAEAAYWYWVIMILSITTVAVVFTVPEEAYPLVYVRYVLGTIYVLWLPGFTLVKMLFPARFAAHSSRKSLDTIERIALSIGMSLALVSIVGLLLNYTPWGIRLTPIMLSLLGLTTIFATVAIVREYQNRLKQ